MHHCCHVCPCSAYTTKEISTKGCLNESVRLLPFLACRVTALSICTCSQSLSDTSSPGHLAHTDRTRCSRYRRSPVHVSAVLLKSHAGARKVSKCQYCVFHCAPSTRCGYSLLHVLAMLLKICRCQRCERVSLFKCTMRKIILFCCKILHLDCRGWRNVCVSVLLSCCTEPKVQFFCSGRPH